MSSAEVADAALTCLGPDFDPAPPGRPASSRATGTVVLSQYEVKRELDDPRWVVRHTVTVMRS